jgi:hypothetical protein
VLKGSKNRTPGVKSEITERDRREFTDIIARIPAAYLEIFQRPPYCDWEWSRLVTTKTNG